MDISRKLGAEFIGTFWLVLGGCGSAVLAAGMANVGIGYAGVALAFGLTVVTGAVRGVERISGAHFNPAVTLGLWTAGRSSGPRRDPLLDRAGGRLHRGRRGALCHRERTCRLRRDGGICKQRLRRTFAAGLQPARLSHLRSRDDGDVPARYLGATSVRAPAGFAPLAIGLALTLIHLVSIPVTNTSVNPARSTGVAIFQGGWALGQLWAFWVAPFVGAALAGFVHRWLGTEEIAPVASKM